jgi:predicted ATPase/class 3 adenylate cyclase
VTEQPTGTVTLLFTDIEGSTALLQRLGPHRYGQALELHRRLLREVFDRHGGYEVDCEGDAFFVAFGRAGDAVTSASEAQQALAAAEWPEGLPIRVRMGIHTGEPVATPPKYVGLDVHKAARIMAAGHGGQVLVSESTQRLLDPTVSLRDLGEHRLKDLSRPEPLFQLVVRGLREEFPGLKTLGNRPHNLPVVATPFIGRERELAAVQELLGDEGVRLLTLTGPGGIGKTRLALQAAAELAERFRDGVYWASLASLRDGNLLAATVAQTLGLREEPGEPIGDTLAHYLAGKQILLLLDNLEHLVDDARTVAAQLLRVASGITVLGTSREALRIGGEQLYDVPPLAMPDVDDNAAMRSDAVVLFTARAQAASPGFALTDANAGAVAEIVRRLDGLPLAIELAAARVRVLPPATLLERLDDRLRLLTTGAHDAEERQRTLRATIEWSYDLLTSEEQTLFQRLGVFVGGCRIDAAEAVCDDSRGELELDLLDGISSLLDKSLLRRRDDPDGQARYWMLATIREFANDRLAADSAGPPTRTAFVDFYERLARETLPTWMAPDSAQYHRRFRAELDNIREAVRLGLADGRPAAALAIVTFFAGQWDVSALHREAAKLLDAAEAAGGANTAELEGMAHHCRGVFAFSVGDAPKAVRHLRASLPLLSDPGIQVWTSYAMFELVRRDDQAEAKRLIEAAVRIAEAEGHPVLRLVTWTCQAQAEADSGAIQRAHAIATQAVATARDISPENGLTTCLFHLGEYAFALGRLSEAREHFRECLSLAGADGFVSMVTDTLPMLALIEMEAGDAPAARAHLRSLKDTVAEHDLDTPRTQGSIALVEALIEQTHGDYAQAITDWARADQLRELQARNWNLVEDRAVARHLAPLRQQPSFDEIWASAFAVGHRD